MAAVRTDSGEQRTDVAGSQGRKRKGAHRIAPPSPVLRGRVVAAAVAIGAVTAAGAGHVSNAAEYHPKGITPLADAKQASAAFGVGGDAGSPDVLVPTHSDDAVAEAQKLAASEQINKDHLAAEAEAHRPKFVKPADGIFTSGFGGRWGAFHYGVDIANVMDTPIVACADGVVIDAGPASGFGLWVRIQLPDGTINVYGHMDTFSVHVGQHVKAGQEIARMGDRGQSTGVHLHFEVWDPTGKKINPLPWLNARGISL